MRPGRDCRVPAARASESLGLTLCGVLGPGTTLAETVTGSELGQLRVGVGIPARGMPVPIKLCPQATVTRWPGPAPAPGPPPLRGGFLSARCAAAAARRRSLSLIGRLPG